jgi:RNA polymerase sigma-70 factor (ECF subfamily)
MALTTQQLADLVARTARRDKAAFSALYEATSAKLFGIIHRILLRRDVAEEVLQEVYVTIWERAGDFDAGRASPITWMATIARNRALDQARRKGHVPIDEAPETLELASDDKSPLEAAEISDDYRRLLECLEGLDPERKSIVLLAYMDGLSREALSQRFAKPVATIKTWLHRSLAQLRQCLDT